RLLMMGQAEEYIGQLMRFEGRVHRCVRVAIDDPILADALGFDHYYELALFIPVDYELSFAGGAAAGGTRRGAAHTDLYPVFACVKQLPPGFPTGEQLNEVADVSGYFFKFWAYPTRFGAVDQAQRIEYSLLIMGPGFRWVSRPHTENSGWALIAGLAFLGVLALLGFVLLRVGRRDLAFRRELAARRSEARQQPELGRPEGSPASE